jgi:hypothetical protein
MEISVMDGKPGDAATDSEALGTDAAATSGAVDSEPGEAGTSD